MIYISFKKKRDLIYIIDIYIYIDTEYIFKLISFKKVRKK